MSTENSGTSEVLCAGGKTGGPEAGLSRRRDAGYSLAEMVLALAIWGMALAVAMPGFAAAMDRARLSEAVYDAAGALRTAQTRAEKTGEFQEVRFAPFEPFYFLFSPTRGFSGPVYLPAPTRYFEGYLHLPQPTVRFDRRGEVNQSGEIWFEDPEGDVRGLTVYMQFGALRTRFRE